LAFASIATPVPTAEELVAQLNATTLLSDFNQSTLQQVISVLGRPPVQTNDPKSLELQAAN